jgi:AcrR family transcriptional regulator
LAERGATSRRKGPADWLAAARAILIAEGIERVKVDRIAKRLGITRGGFYWHFRDRQALLDALLRDWERGNTTAFIEAVGQASGGIEARILAIFTIWIEARPFDPRYDMAVRDWARVSPAVRRAVHRADGRRIHFIRSLFEAEGYDGREALVRARVLYYTQIGYYALEVHETVRARLALADLYFEIFTGSPLSATGLRTLKARFLRNNTRTRRSIQ